MRTVSWVVFSLMLILHAGHLPADEVAAPSNRILPRNSQALGGDFTLQSKQGPVSTAEFRGSLILLYFGYTSCPDVCPTSFSLMAQALNELEAEYVKQVVGIFVSVDTKRDDVNGLAEYVAYFHPNFIGVTGTPEAVALAAEKYGVQYSVNDTADSAMGYLVDHSAVIYLVDQQGVLRFAFPHDTPSETLLGAIRMLFETP